MYGFVLFTKTYTFCSTASNLHVFTLGITWMSILKMWEIALPTAPGIDAPAFSITGFALKGPPKLVFGGFWGQGQKYLMGTPLGR